MNFEVNDSQNKSKLKLILTDNVDENNNLFAPPALPYGMHVVFKYKGEDYYTLNINSEDMNDLQISLNFGADKKVTMSWDNEELKTFENLVVIPSLTKFNISV